MFGEPLITIIFRILNFVALMGLFAFMFKKYFRKEIEASIEDERLKEIDLHTRISQTAQRGSELSEEIIKQEKLCVHLVARADQWKTSFEKYVKQKQHERTLLHIQLVKRAEEQAKAIERERLMQAVLPQALEITRNKLMESFKPSAHGKEFVQNIITSMKKSL